MSVLIYNLILPQNEPLVLTVYCNGTVTTAEKDYTAIEMASCAECKYRFNYGGLCIHHGDNWFCGNGSILQ